MEFRGLLIGPVVILIAARLGAEVMERLGQTAVLGKLLAGGVIGPGVLGLALAFAVVAIGSKLVAGLAVYHPGTRRWSVGVGMVPRGEVGLIFAGAGLAATVVAQDLYSALVVMAMITTFVTPVWQKVPYRVST
jgi:Kef-type K+ transport system membrane component KefB